MLMVISGLHRSGTTFVGDILRHAGVSIVHEPLNEDFGMSDVPMAYPFVESRSDACSQLLDDAINLSRPWNKDTTYIQARGIHRWIYALSGGRSGLRWGWLRFRTKFGIAPTHLCLKDPFMSLATPYLVKYHGVNVVCMVRHPAAIHYSTEKQNWRFDVDNLLNQPELIARYGADIPRWHWNLAHEHAAASIALLWKLMMRINVALAQENKRLLMIRHEELCIKPQETARSICKHFGIPYTPALKQFVFEHSEGDRAEARDGITHDFRRNSRALVNVWRGRISGEDEAMMREIVGEEVDRYYGKW